MHTSKCRVMNCVSDHWNIHCIETFVDIECLMKIITLLEAEVYTILSNTAIHGGDSRSKISNSVFTTQFVTTSLGAINMIWHPFAFLPVDMN